MATDSVTAVGVWFYSVATQRYLYLMRADDRHHMTWALPGGKVRPGETLLAAMHRECAEEMGHMPAYVRLAPLEKFTSTDRGFVYHTFFCTVVDEFCPVLNHEHLGWAWIQAEHWPRPMHPGLWSTINIDAVRDKVAVMQQLAHT